MCFEEGYWFGLVWGEGGGGCWLGLGRKRGRGCSGERSVTAKIQVQN